MPFINLFNYQVVMSSYPMGRGKEIHNNSILFHQVDIRIRTDYLGPAGIKGNGYRLDAPETEAVNVKVRLDRGFRLL